MGMKTSSPNMTSQILYVCFQSRRGHFWFVSESSRKPSDFLILSTTVCAKPNFEGWFCFLLAWLMFLKRIFNKRKIVQILLHLTFKNKLLMPGPDRGEEWILCSANLIVSRVKVDENIEIWGPETKFIVIPPNSNMFFDWRRMRHVPWVITHYLPRVNKTH